MPQVWHLLFFTAKKSKQKKAATNQNFNHVLPLQTNAAGAAMIKILRVRGLNPHIPT
jgi:hypothetical protein